MTNPKHPESWLKVTPADLYGEPGGFHIDPARPVERAVITHGHADHARPGHRRVLATPGTLAIMMWVTYGHEEALIHYAVSRGIRARTLSLIGREEEVAQ
jgi:hypothetical protein